MKVPSSSRSRSGLAWASCSSSIRAGSILGLTVIVVSFFELVLADHSKDHAVAVAYLGDTLTAEPYTTLLDSTRTLTAGCGIHPGYPEPCARALNRVVKIGTLTPAESRHGRYDCEDRPLRMTGGYTQRFREPARALPVTSHPGRGMPSAGDRTRLRP